MTKTAAARKERRSLLARFSVKWQDFRKSDFLREEPFAWLMTHGLVDAGTDVAVSQVNEPPTEFFRFQFTGMDWERSLCSHAYSLSESASPRLLHILPDWFYVRLTDAGVAALQSDRWPRRQKPFSIEEVDAFDEVETEADRQRFEADSQLRLGRLPSLHEGWQEIKGARLKFTVTRNAIRRRVTSREAFRLQNRSTRCVVGEEHADAARDLIASLWPDLSEEIELTGSTQAWQRASGRMQNWTGIGLPECHRDWRLLSEWAGLQPDEITDQWIQDHLYPRLVILWRQFKSEEREDLGDTLPNCPTQSPGTPEGEVAEQEMQIDFQYDGEWLTVAVCESRFGLNRQNLTRWATQKCPHLDDRLLRRKMFPPGQTQWCYHLVDIETIIEARDRETQDAA